MLWTPTGPSVAVAIAPGPATLFVPVSSGNLGGVVRVWGGTAGGTFTLGGSAMTADTYAIPLAAGQDIIVAYGPDVTHIIAGAASTLFAQPGIGRM